MSRYPHICIYMQKITESLMLEGTSGVCLAHLLCSQHVHVGPFAQEFTQLGVEYLQEWRTHHISGKPFYRVQPPSQEKIKIKKKN